MSQLTIHLSDKADALIAQLQKEIFNRRRKKVSAAGVIETLVESGAKSQSDKRFATSWTNLVADIEKAARVAHAHGAKPANLSDEEWAMVLSHRTRVVAPAAAPRKATGTGKGTQARHGATTKRVAKTAANATTTGSPSSGVRSKPARTAAKGAQARASKPKTATASVAPEAATPKAPRPAAGKRTAKAGAATKPARSLKASTAAAKPSAKPTAAKAPAKRTAKASAESKVTRPRVAKSRNGQTQPSVRVAKAAPKSTGPEPSTAMSLQTTPAAETIAITPSAAASPTRNRRKSGSPTTPVARSRSPRASAASRMAKAVSRLGANTNPLPPAESAPVALAMSSNGTAPAAAPSL